MGMDGYSWFSITKCYECLRMADNLNRMLGNSWKSEEKPSTMLETLRNL